MELWFFLGAAVVVLVVLAARNGAFRPFRRATDGALMRSRRSAHERRCRSAIRAPRSMAGIGLAASS
ncbi:MAG: hypothetical protein QOI92_506 [Chloroflexota bacterium]|jgi:hypothetical protein|nr:hypothetical protein [Chloroflexota bacterium]